MAIETSVMIVRAFVKLREILSTNAELAKKIAEMEKKYDNQFKVVFETLKALTAAEPQKTDRTMIGYKVTHDKKD